MPRHLFLAAAAPPRPRLRRPDARAYAWQAQDAECAALVPGVARAWAEQDQDAGAAPGRWALGEQAQEAGASDALYLLGEQDQDGALRAPPLAGGAQAQEGDGEAPAQLRGEQAQDAAVSAAARAAGEQDQDSEVATVRAWPNGYRYQFELRIPAEEGAAATAQADFWVLDSITDASLKTKANGGLVESASGWDIRYELPDGTKLPHVLLGYSATTGAIMALVKRPGRVMSAADTIYRYVGKAGLAASEEDRAGAMAGVLACLRPTAGDDSGQGRALVSAGTGTTTVMGFWPAASYNGTDARSATAAAATWLHGLSALTVLAVGRANTLGARSLLGLGGVGSLSLRATAAGRVVWGCKGAGGLRELQTEDGALKEDKGFAVAVTYKDGEVPVCVLATEGYHGVGVTLAATPGAASGATSLPAEPLRVGEDTAMPAAGARWHGAIGLVLLLSVRPSNAALRAMTRNLLTPRLAYGTGAANEAGASGRKPVAMPLVYEVAPGATTDLDIIGGGGGLDPGDTITLDAAVSPQPAAATASVANGKLRLAASATASGETVVGWRIKDAAGNTADGQALIRYRAGQSPGWWRRYYRQATDGKWYEPYGGHPFTHGVMSFNYHKDYDKFIGLLGFRPAAIGGNVAGTQSTPKRCDTMDKVIGGAKTYTGGGNDPRRAVQSGTQMDLRASSHIVDWFDDYPADTWCVPNMTMAPHRALATNFAAADAVKVWQDIADGKYSEEHEIMGARWTWYIENAGGSNVVIRKPKENFLIRINWEFNQKTGLAPNFYQTCIAAGKTVDQATALYNAMMRQWATDFRRGAGYHVPIALSPAQESTGWNSSGKTPDEWLDTWMEAGIYDLICCSWHPRVGRSDTLQEAGESTFGLVCSNTTGLPVTPERPISYNLFTPGAAIRAAKRWGKAASFLEASPIGDSSAEMGPGTHYAKCMNDFFDLLNDPANADCVSFVNMYNPKCVTAGALTGTPWPDKTPSTATAEQIQNWRNMVAAHSTKASKITRAWKA